MFITFIGCSACSQSYYQLVSSRYLIGLCIGGVSEVSTMFIAEKAPALLRGKFTMINSITITTGQALAFLIGYLLHDILNQRLLLLTGLLDRG